MSSSDRKADPVRQVARLARSGHRIAEYITEVGSALSAQRRGFAALEDTHVRDDLVADVTRDEVISSPCAQLHGRRLRRGGVVSDPWGITVS